MHAGSYNTESLIEFLEEFHTHFAGEKVTLIWDGLPSHTSKAMKTWIRTQTPLARRRTAPRLLTRPQSGRTGVGQRQRPGAGQSLS